MPQYSPDAGEDTIAAIATGIGGSISIIRVSGSDCLAVASQIWQSTSHLSARRRTLTLGKIVTADGAVVDTCMAVYLESPHTYTGEDIVEFHCHGGSLICHAVLSLLMKAGARLAEPGEFTKRAFINGKMDLTQAEAVLDVIQARSRMALHAANRQLEGSLRQRIETVYNTIAEVLSEIEVRMDFCDEELDWRDTDALAALQHDAIRDISGLLRSREEGEVLRNGVRVVIAGVPNAGKSSLMNRMLGRDRAIVTNIPGTTRDTLEESAQIRGIPIHLIDTAGLRDTDNKVEQEGVLRSRASIAGGEIILWVVDASQSFQKQVASARIEKNANVIVVANKMDLVDAFTSASEVTAPLVQMSILHDQSLDPLYDTIEHSVRRRTHAGAPDIAINSRHYALLEDAQNHVSASIDRLKNDAFELVAVDLRAALDTLGRITGKTVQPDILDNIFHKFCIGK